MHPLLETQAMLARAIRRDWAGRIALVSSFGTEAAVLLHLVAGIDRATPVIMIDTGKLFAQTLAYRDTLARDLGLADLRIASPRAAALAVADPDGALHARAPDRCCQHRKVAPLAAALAPFGAWISGRKRFHGGERAALPRLETGADGRLKLNPLAGWSEADLAAYAAAFELPPHPLAAAGYGSVGCMPCTRPGGPGGGVRAGRWAGTSKTECGIHTRLPASLRAA